MSSLKIMPQLQNQNQLNANSLFVERMILDGRVELAVVDTALPEYEVLLDALDPEIEVLLISSDNGFVELAGFLQGRDGIDALHVFSHGEEGALHLGEDILNTASLDEHRSALDSIAMSLAEDGDLLLYGCSIASAEGQEFVELLAVELQADVAASDDATGSSRLGGDWDLEIVTGSIESTVYQPDDYEYLLPATGTISVVPVNGTSVTAAGLVASLVPSGSGITTSNASLSGENAAAGLFTNGLNANLGFDTGVVLSTGLVSELAAFPDGGYLNTDFGADGTDGDTATLNFDFVPSGSQIVFTFRFGSEEELGGTFADGFALNINGTNVALLPNGTTPVNATTLGGAYGYNNSSSDFGIGFGYYAASGNNNGSGISITLTATANVNAGSTNSASFSISDASDGQIDSAVFIAGNTLRVNTAPSLDNPITDTSANAGGSFSFQFDANTFSDTDTGDTLTYSATLADDSALPSWLSFDAGTRTFSGMRPLGNTTTYDVKVTATDGGGLTATDTFSIAAISNTDPTLTIAASTLAYMEGDMATQVDSIGILSDADGDADWNGGTLEAQITTNAEAADEISISDTDGDGTAITISGTDILSNGTDIGDLSTSGGIVTGGTKLSITFDADATNANVQEVLQSIRYRNTSNDPGTGNRTVTITATDTNAGTANDTRTISVTAIDEEPTLSTIAATPIFVEDGAAVGLFSGSSIGTVEAGQNITELKLSVTNVSGDGSTEHLVIDGSTVALSNGGSDTTAANAFGYSVALSGTTATVTISKNASAASYQTLVDGIQYGNSLADVDALNRVVSISSITDSGSNSGGSDNVNSALSAAATVSMSNVNDEPTLSATGDDPAFQEGGAAVGLFSSAAISTVEAGQTITELKLSVTNVSGDGGAEHLVIDGESVALSDTNSGSTINNGFGYSVVLAGGTATVTIAKSDSVANWQTLVNDITYENTGSGIDTNARVVTITSATDSGGIANSGDDTNAALSVSSTVSSQPSPSITSALYDWSTGQLTLTGTDFVSQSGALNDVDASMFNFTGEGGVNYMLTDTSDVEISSATSVSITLSARDRLNVQGLLNKDGTEADDNTLYNLAAAEDWMTGSPAAALVADASNSITVSNVNAPSITSATYDSDTGVLAVTGTHFTKLAGADNDIDVSSLTLTGEGGSYTLTSATDVEIDSDSAFTVTLSGADKTNVDTLLDQIGTSSSGGSTYNLAVADNWMRGAAASADIADTSGNGITVSIAAKITNSTYDADTGVLVVTGSNIPANGGGSDIDISKLTLTGEGGATHALTDSPDVNRDNATQFTVTLSATDRAAVNQILNKDGSSSTAGTSYNLGAADDWATGDSTGGDISDPTGNAITVSNVPAPSITSALYDAATGVLSVTGSGLLQRDGAGNDIDASLLSITGEGGATHTLTNSADVEITNGTAFSVTLAATDRTAVNQIINKDGTSSTGGTTYNLGAAEDWNAGADPAAAIVDGTGNGVTASSVAAPTITSATYHSGTGVLVVTGIGLLALTGAANDIDASLLTFTGEGGGTYDLSDSSDVDIDSATQFSVTLSATDKAGVNALLNQDGTSSGDNTTYNLAANEDWAAGADVAVNVADASGNGITVTLNQSPQITSDGGGDTATLSVAENTTALTTVRATDADAGDTPTFGISGGVDQAKFSIDANTGALSFKAAANFENPGDSDAGNDYLVEVSAADGKGGTDVQTITVNVSDQNEAPTAVGLTGITGSLPEDTNTGTRVKLADLAISDDGLGTNTVTLSGADAEDFEVDGGQLFLKAGVALDFEIQTAYAVTVNVQDLAVGGTPVSTGFSLDITNVNEAPVITSDGGGDTATLSVAENTTAVTTVRATDADVSDTPSFSITGGADQAKFSIDAGSGALHFVSAPNFEGPTDSDGNNDYLVELTATDGEGGSDTQTLTVSVTNVNEFTPPPTPPPTSTPSLPPAPDTVDGVEVDEQTSTQNGVQTTTVTVPVVTPNRQEDPSTDNHTLAEIPVVTDGSGNTLVEVGIPVGVGLTAESSSGGTQGLREQLIAASGPRIDDQTVFDAILQQGIDSFVAQVAVEDQVRVSTISFTNSGDTPPNEPIRIKGASGAGEDDTANPNRQEALIIDARDLPSGTVLQFDNVEFAIVIGASRIEGGDGRNFVVGDGAAQFIVLGAEDDQLSGGGGDDVIGSAGGDDLVAGDTGNDLVFGGIGDDTVDGGDGSDTLMGGGNDSGQWRFSLDDSGLLSVSQTPSSGSFSSAARTVDRNSLNTGVSDLAFLNVDEVRLALVSTLFEAVVGQPMSLDQLNHYSNSGYSDLGLAQLAVDTLSAIKGWSALDDSAFGSALGEHLLGRPLSEAEQVFVDGYFAQGHSQADLMLYGAQLDATRGHLFGDGQLLAEVSQNGQGWYKETGNDSLLGGAGDDRLIGGDGSNLVDGGEGSDTLVYAHALEALRVYLTRNPENSENSHDRLMLDTANGNRTVFRDIEWAEIEGVTHDIRYLNQNGEQLETLGMLSQILFDEAPGAGFINAWKGLSDDPRSLVDAVLATPDSQALFDGLDNGELAELLIRNALGTDDQDLVDFAEDYMAEHGMTDLVLLGLDSNSVLNNAYGDDGLALI